MSQDMTHDPDHLKEEQLNMRALGKEGDQEVHLLDQEMIGISIISILNLNHRRIQLNFTT